ncbi:MAG: hydroxymethylbilane synthase [Clostridia bacterium]|nr:hydroxymethylbilane synthase [Deltaproteobacteria bacterium]
MTLRIGSRGSDLALWQARYVAARLGDAEIIVIKTRGDQIQNMTLDKVEGKGFFTKELENALLSHEVDVAVHSYKDLPTEAVLGLTIAAVPERASVNDVVIADPSIVDPAEPIGVKAGARIGTSSLRRKAQLAYLQPSVMAVDIRGNVPTRLARVGKDLDAVVLALAGVTRLGLLASTTLAIHVLPVDAMTPAPAQGALAIQTRSEDASAIATVASLDDYTTRVGVDIERQLLARFGGGCHLPLGAYATGNRLIATVTAPDGTVRCHADERGAEVVERAHAALVSQGAARYL